jgi:hypothetical protein
MTPLYLPLTDMSDRYPGLTQLLAASYNEAARVCLDRHHTSPTGFKVQDGTKHVHAVVEWETIDERAQRHFLD